MASYLILQNSLMSYNGLQDPPSSGHLLPLCLISHFFLFSRSAPATPDYLSVFAHVKLPPESVSALATPFAWRILSTDIFMSHPFTFSHVHSTIIISEKSFLTTLYKVTPTPLMLFSNLLAMFHFSLGLSTA